ncbi:hypothetical protein Tco_0741696 [Tanacetum coccineum]
MLVHKHIDESNASPSRITSSPSLSQQPTQSSPLPEPIQPTHEAQEAASMPYDLPLHDVHSHRSAEGSVQQHDLTVLVTKLNERIDGLEKDLQQTKKTYSTALTKLVLRIPQEEEVHEKPSDETEVIVQEETPTKIIEEHGSGEKGKMEISTASPLKVTKVKKRTQVQLSMDKELTRKMEEEERIRFNIEQKARALPKDEKKEAGSN